MASRKLEVEIVGDASSLSRAFGKASKSGSGFGHALTGLAKTAGLVVGGAALGGLAVVLKQGAEEFQQHAAVAAQTNAVLKSTGGIAGITAKHVDDLANSILRKTGIDDEAVQASENLLLGFTKVRNEVGKGNDVFDRATMLVQDYAVRTGKSATQASIAFGKALNDPVKGMGALGRAGVILTDGQKKLIKGWADHGQTLKAQTYLLGLLETRFGGAAEAAGKTLAGKLNLLKESFNNLAGEIVSGLAPALTSVVDHLSNFIGKVSDAHGASGKLGVVWDTLKSSVVSVAGGIKDAFNAIDWAAVGATIADGLRGALRFLGSVDYGGILHSAAAKLFDGIRTAFNAINWGEVGRTVGTALIGALNKLGEFIRSVNWNNVGQELIAGLKVGIVALSRFLAGVDWMSVLGALVRGVAAVLKAVGSLALGLATAIGKEILKGIGAGLGELGRWLRGKLAAIGTAISTVAGQAYGWATNIGKQIVAGILAGIVDLPGKVGGKIKDGVSGAVHFAGGLLHGSGEFMFTKQAIGLPMAKGVIEGWLEGTASLPSAINERLSAAIEKGRQLIDSKRSVFAIAFGRLTDRIFTAFDAATSQHQTPAEKLIAQITDRRQMEDLQQALADAISGGDPQAIFRAQEDIQLVSLQKQAADERQNYNARRDNLRQSLEDRLTMLQTHFTKEGATVGELTKGIVALLKSFGIDFANVGDLLGNAFLSGLKKAIATAGKGSSAIEKTIATVADNIRTTVPTGKAFAMASGGMGRVTRPTMFYSAGNEDFAFSGEGKRFGGSGGVTINLTVNGDITGQELLEKVRRGLAQVVRDNGSLGFAT